MRQNINMALAGHLTRIHRYVALLAATQIRLNFLSTGRSGRPAELLLGARMANTKMMGWEGEPGDSKRGTRGSKESGYIMPLLEGQKST